MVATPFPPTDLDAPLIPWTPAECRVIAGEWARQATERRKPQRPKNRLPAEDRADIRREYRNGCMRMGDLAAAYDISKSTVLDILREAAA